jgi:hypothetical protein
MDALIKEHIKQTPQATNGKFVFEASKNLVREFPFRNDSDPQFFALEKLEHVFDCCKDLNSPHI